VVGAGLAAQRAGVPAAWMIAGLGVGLAVALLPGEPLELPQPASYAAQAVIGAAIGAGAGPALLADVSRDLPVVAGVALGTLCLSVVTGLLLARVSSIDRPTAVFGALAGAADGVMSASHEARVDVRLVAVMQYVRILLVIGSVPVLVGGLFDVGPSSARPGVAGPPVVGAAWFGLVVVVGALTALRLRVPVGALIGPLVLAIGAAAAGVPLLVPAPMAAGALALIGLSVGLTFDTAALRRAGRLLPVMVAGVLGVIGGCAALAVVLVHVAGVDGLTGYLATSPGGLTSVVATAYDTGANTSVVLAVQLLRFLVMVAAVSVLAGIWPSRVRS
jgi:uncharacterized protein